MTRPKARLERSIAMAEEAIVAAYFDACEDAHAAVDPANLTDVAWACAFLDDIYEYALALEADPAAWGLARSVFTRRITPPARARRGFAG
jgi:hypothetical protein